MNHRTETESLWSRREMLGRIACGFGSVALAGLLAEESAAAEKTGSSPAGRALAPKASHFPARAKRVIFLFMHGGVSHVDSFDPKPRLAEMNGKPLPFPKPKFEFAPTGNLLASPWKFRKYGQSGIEVSDLFPQVGSRMDDICVIRSMNGGKQVSHGPALLTMHTGDGVFNRPSVGAWVLYGLGTENQDLPGFVALSPSVYHGGAQNYGSAFLPASYQGVRIGDGFTPFKDARLANTSPADGSLQRLQLDFLRKANLRHRNRPEPERSLLPAEEPESSEATKRAAGGARTPEQDRSLLPAEEPESSEEKRAAGGARPLDDARLDARIQAFETAFRMQSAAPKLLDLSGETRETRALYGIDVEPTDEFGRQCLLARRLAEAGVRFVQVNHSYPRNYWDAHGGLRANHSSSARKVDQPIAGLLADLKRRGLLADTLVVWGTEFGRTPAAQGNDGRDHHPHAFSAWLAGGGIKGGTTYGKTDEFGYYVAENKVTMPDFHATILHCLGLDHERLTYRHAGRDFRLTDVHGRVLEDILA